LEIEVLYGKGHMKCKVPDENLSAVYRKSKMPPVSGADEAIRVSLAAPVGSKPLSEVAKGGETACIVINDITRPVPNRLLLPRIIDELHEAGVPDEGIFILNATGTHRPNLDDEIIELVGEEIAAKYRFENHYAFRDEDHVPVGRTAGGFDVLIDRRYVEADVKILTGLIEPHFMAGYSGGRKALCPGLASIKTIHLIHSPKILEDESSENCVIPGNPLHVELQQACEMAGVDFIVNVVINEDRELCGVFSGHYDRAHMEGVRFARQYDEIKAEEPVEIVVTSSAGYPLDKTYYQTVKGMVGALKIVKTGGTVIIASECSEGIGNETFADCLRKLDEIGDTEKYIEYISRFANFVPDQWQVEMLVKALRKAEIMLVTDNLSEQDLSITGATPMKTLDEAVQRALEIHGSAAKIAVIPEGPYVIPTLS